LHLHISIQKLTDQDEAPKENLGSACTLLKLNKYRQAAPAYVNYIISKLLKQTQGLLSC